MLEAVAVGVSVAVSTGVEEGVDYIAFAQGTHVSLMQYTRLVTKQGMSPLAR